MAGVGSYNKALGVEVGAVDEDLVVDSLLINASGWLDMRLPSSSGHPICADLVSVGEDVHCESTAQEVHAGVPA